MPEWYECEADGCVGQKKMVIESDGTDIILHLRIGDESATIKIETAGSPRLIALREAVEDADANGQVDPVCGA